MKSVISYIKILFVVALAIFIYRNFNTAETIWKESDFDFFYLLISILLIIVGYIVSSLCWQKSLESCGIKIELGQAFNSYFLTVLIKYLPGKLLHLIGRAEYVSRLNNQPRNKTNLASFLAQIISVITGLLIGGFYFISHTIPINLKFLWALLPLSVFFCLIFRHRINRLINYLELSALWYVVIFYLFNWIVFSLSIYCLAHSMNISISFITAFSLPLSICIGILAIIAPGGIGVREGALVYLFIQSGISETEALSLSVACRFWFVIVEILLFTSSLMATSLTKRLNNAT